jgi:malonyl-CoA/methylmalonyl-CoA synthetase
MDTLPIIARAQTYGHAVALRCGDRQYAYHELLARSECLAGALLDGRPDLHEARIAFLAPPGIDYAAIQWAVWRAGGVAVPLSLSAAEPETEYTLSDSQATTVVATRELLPKVQSPCERAGLRLLPVDERLVDERRAATRPTLPTVDAQRRAMMLYTSGTTSRPKGVVTTHANMQAQIESLVDAWKWRPDDCIPLFLPLHHIHGIINVLSCGLWAGATIETFALFDVTAILDRVAAGAYTLFMAVPTIYVRLIQTLESLPDEPRRRIVQGFARMRLMVSGSAALPASVHQQWEALTGQKLLERYGMTEIGMALSNPYDGERRPGTVGLPLPGVDIRLVSEEGTVVADGQPGEIQVRGPGVFREYWQRADETARSFRDGWFLTGDVAVLERGYYRILGRQSVDIIKSGGYKLSALEIEAVLLQHPAILECAVVGLPDPMWGEAVAVAAVLAAGQSLQLESLRDWCRPHLSHYKIPHRLQAVDQLPRNAMGKVTKPAVRELF